MNYVVATSTSLFMGSLKLTFLGHALEGLPGLSDGVTAEVSVIRPALSCLLKILGDGQGCTLRELKRFTD